MLPYIVEKGSTYNMFIIQGGGEEEEDEGEVN